MLLCIYENSCLQGKKVSLYFISKFYDNSLMLASTWLACIHSTHKESRNSSLLSDSHSVQGNQKLPFKDFFHWVPVAHAYNPSYLRD
jgi:hypothetical protein